MLNQLVSFILYFLIGMEIFVNLPINLGLFKNLNKDQIITGGLIISLITALGISMCFTLSWPYALGGIVCWYVVTSLLIKCI